MAHLIEVEPREPGGKGVARRLRTTGKVPGIMYRKQQRSLPFAVDPAVLRASIKGSGYGLNTVLKVTGLEREALALVKATQTDPVKRHLLHLDLVEVREDEEVVVEIPVHPVGHALGVVDGGTLQFARRTLAVACKPLTMPKELNVDVSHLEINMTVHVSDVVFPEGTRSEVPGTWTICTVIPPPAVEETPVEAEAIAEGAEGETPEGGDAAEAPAEQSEGDKK